MDRRIITRAEFNKACDALWSEIEYVNNLPRLTGDEAKDVPGFLTLLRRYTRYTEDVWADNPGEEQPDGTIQVDEALECLRILTVVSLRAMVYCGIRARNTYVPPAANEPTGFEQEVRNLAALVTANRIRAVSHGWGPHGEEISFTLDPEKKDG